MSGLQACLKPVKEKKRITSGRMNRRSEEEKQDLVRRRMRLPGRGEGKEEREQNEATRS